MSNPFTVKRERPCVFCGNPTQRRVGVPVCTSLRHGHVHEPKIEGVRELQDWLGAAVYAMHEERRASVVEAIRAAEARGAISATAADELVEAVLSS